MIPVEEIELLRKSHRISKSALVERAGINPSTYATMLKPMRLGPTLSTMMRLETALQELINDPPPAKRRRA